MLSVIAVRPAGDMYERVRPITLSPQRWLNDKYKFVLTSDGKVRLLSESKAKIYTYYDSIADGISKLQGANLDAFITCTKMTKNKAGGYVMKVDYSSSYTVTKADLETIKREMSNLCVEFYKEKSGIDENVLDKQAIVFSEAKGITHMFKVGTSFDEVTSVLEKRSIEIDSSFKVFFPSTGEVKKLVAKPQKVVLRFE